MLCQVIHVGRDNSVLIFNFLYYYGAALAYIVYTVVDKRFAFRHIVSKYRIMLTTYEVPAMIRIYYRIKAGITLGQLMLIIQNVRTVN